MKKSWCIRTWDLRQTTIPAHWRHRDWRQCEIKNIVGWKRFTFLTHEMDYSGCTLLYKVLGKINGAHRGNAVSDMNCIPVSFGNPDDLPDSIPAFDEVFHWSDIWRVSLGDLVSEKLMSFSVHCVCTYSAGTRSEHYTTFPTFCALLYYSDFVVWTHFLLPQEIAAAAVCHFL